MTAFSKNTQDFINKSPAVQRNVKMYAHEQGISFGKLISVTWLNEKATQPVRINLTRNTIRRGQVKHNEVIKDRLNAL